MPERDILDDLDNLVGSDPDDASVLRKAREALKAPQTKFSPYSEESQKFGNLPDNEILDTIKQLRILRRTAEVSAARDAGTPKASPEDLALRGQMNTWKAENPPPDSQATKYMKSLAQLASWGPAVFGGPAGLYSRIALGSLGLADTYMNMDNPPDFSASAASAGLGHGLNKLQASNAFRDAVFRDWNKSGLSRIATTGGLSGLRGALEAGVPGLVTDRGPRAPDENTWSAARWGGALGALSGVLGKGVFSAAAQKSGTSKLTDSALSEWGSLAKPNEVNPQMMGRNLRLLATERLSPRIRKVAETVMEFDSLAQQHAAALESRDMAKAASLLKAKTAAQKKVLETFGENPDAIPRAVIANLNKSGGLRPLMNHTLDTLFRGSPTTNTVDAVVGQLKGLKALAKASGPSGEKNLRAFTLGHLLENFATPSKEGAEFLERQAQRLNYITNEVFPEHKDLPQILKKFVDGAHGAMREAIANGDQDIGLFTSGAGIGVRIRNAWWKIKPVHMVEKIQQGKAPLLASFGDAAGYLKDARKNPLKRARLEQAMGKMLMDFGFEKDAEQ